MKAWQFPGPGAAMVIVDLPDPVAGVGQVVIDVKAAGLCKSDVSLMDGTISWMLAFTPIVLGHEVAGIISQVGEGVIGFAVGDRVGVAGAGLDAPGLTLDGGFAEKCIGKVEQLVAMPAGVPFSQAAAGVDAGMTSYHAVMVAGGVTAGTRVGIIGLGGLGMTGARIAVIAGAAVYAAEINEAVWEKASALGVSGVVKDVVDLAQFNLDVIIDFAGFGTTTAAAVHAINPFGRIVQVGLSATEITIDCGLFVSKQLHLVGSLGGQKADAENVYALIDSGELEITVTEITFDEIGEGIERLHRGGLLGRLVALITPGN